MVIWSRSTLYTKNIQWLLHKWTSRWMNQWMNEENFAISKPKRAATYSNLCNCLFCFPAQLQRPYAFPVFTELVTMPAHQMHLGNICIYSRSCIGRNPFWKSPGNWANVLCMAHNMGKPEEGMISSCWDLSNIFILLSWQGGVELEL